MTTTDDDGFDPFADEDENEKAEAKQRLANQVQKEAESNEIHLLRFILTFSCIEPVEIAKSCIVLDVCMQIYSLLNILVYCVPIGQTMG